ncbi:MAG: hypothetical protein JW902_08435 [Syntrophaceae bacterium]|nr:hypothetical protein [Syntrophaceae bacterium]
MIEKEVFITLNEWEEVHPEPGSPTDGLRLPPDKKVRELAFRLNRERKVRVLSLDNGIYIKSFSYVGIVRFGNLRVVIKPKIPYLPLLNLFRYAYGFRKLQLYSNLEYETGGESLQDLLIRQMILETDELIARGLHKQYIQLNARLSFLRGKIDFQKFAYQGGVVAASIPCIYHPRYEDGILNQFIKAGLKIGIALTNDMSLRYELRRRVALFDEFISDIQIDRQVYRNLRMKMNRLSRAYEPVIMLISILLDSSGILFEVKSEQGPKLPGFLFDMNRFFQTVVSRFLSENLQGYQVRDEYGLKSMISYIEEFNPKKKISPKPRPDFVIFKDNRINAILDAKYRNLWTTDLPRDMLYQLSIYALSQKSVRESAILYPDIGEGAKIAKLEIKDPVYSGRHAVVTLRPLNLLKLNDYISDPVGTRKERERFAEYLAFGEN